MEKGDEIEVLVGQTPSQLASRFIVNNDQRHNGGGGGGGTFVNRKSKGVILAAGGGGGGGVSFTTSTYYGNAPGGAGTMDLAGTSSQGTAYSSYFQPVSGGFAGWGGGCEH